MSGTFEKLLLSKFLTRGVKPARSQQSAGGAGGSGVEIKSQIWIIHIFNVQMLKF